MTPAWPIGEILVDRPPLCRDSLWTYPFGTPSGCLLAGGNEWLIPQWRKAGLNPITNGVPTLDLYGTSYNDSMGSWSGDLAILLQSKGSTGEPSGLAFAFDPDFHGSPEVTVPYRDPQHR